MQLTYLDISSCHLTLDTMLMLRDFADPVAKRAETLIAANWPAMTIADYDEGIFVTVPDTAIDLSTIPQDLRTVLLMAREKKVSLIRLDSMGDVIDGLPYFDWCAEVEAEPS